MRGWGEGAVPTDITAAERVGRVCCTQILQQQVCERAGRGAVPTDTTAVCM